MVAKTPQSSSGAVGGLQLYKNISKVMKNILYDKILSDKVAIINGERGTAVA